MKKKWKCRKDGERQMEMTLQERLLEEWSLSESSSEGYDEYPNDEPELMTFDILKENVVVKGEKNEKN